MTIQVRLFAALRELAQTSQLSLDLLPGATAASARQELEKRFPKLAEAAARAALAVNFEYAQPDRQLADGDEVALIPAVSGG